MKLIRSMRSEYESVQQAKGAQEDELKRLKERMLLGVSKSHLCHYHNLKGSGEVSPLID